jgi:hypothetical protein
MPSAPPRVPARVSGSLFQALASIDQSVAIRRMRSQSRNLNWLLLGDAPNRVGHITELLPSYTSKIQQLHLWGLLSIGPFSCRITDSTRTAASV